MSDELTSIQYNSLLASIQDYATCVLSTNYELSSWGIPVLPEHILDIEFMIKQNLGRQGIVAVANTLKGSYAGHNGMVEAWKCELEVDVVEDPTIRRAWMKKHDLSVGSTVDACYQIAEVLGGPQYGNFGRFTPKNIDIGEDGKVLVGKCTFDCIMYNDISGVMSSDQRIPIPFALKTDISALQDEIDDLSGQISSSVTSADLSNYMLKTIPTDMNQSMDISGHQYINFTDYEEKAWLEIIGTGQTRIQKGYDNKLDYIHNNTSQIFSEGNVITFGIENSIYFEVGNTISCYSTDVILTDKGKSLNDLIGNVEAILSSL